MSEYKRKPGDVVIFKNNYKDTDSKPDYTGTVLGLNDEDLEIALWVREGKNGKFFSGRMQESYKKMDSKKPNPVNTNEDDGLPF